MQGVVLMLLQALEKCQLKRTVRSLPNLFDSSVSDEGENWSVGQRPLFSTNDILQEIIREEFSSCAVITVAHRVPTVIDQRQGHGSLFREKVAAGVIKTVKVSWLSVKIKLIDLVFFSECLSDSVVRLDSDPPSGDQSLPVKYENVTKVTSCNGMKLREGLFPVDIRRSSSGVKLLGGAVSSDADFISGLAMRRATNAVDLMGLLPQLHDPQSELLLLRSCMGIAKLFFGLRTCQPVHIEEAALFFDKGLRGSIENIVVCGGSFFEDLQWRLASLPIRFGGLGFGICGMDDDYVSALACLRDTIPSFDFSGFTNKDTFDMIMRQKAVFECLRAPHAQDFLLAIHIDGLGQHMSPVKYRTILKYRLMIPLFPVDAIRPVCRKACLDSFGEHAVHCKELPGFKYRHDMVRDVLFDICRRHGISAKKESPVNFLTDPSDGRSTLRPADVLVFGWVGGKHACVDLTGVSPLVGLSSRGFTAGQAALKAASGKVTKHEKACIENQHVFIPFAFDAFGFLAPESVELLSRVQRVMHNNVI
ncbi:hypothetical protein Tco_1541041 [Tanacetum coccineum]